MQALLTNSANKASLSQLGRAFDLSCSGLYSARERTRTPWYIDLSPERVLQAAFIASGRTHSSRRLSTAIQREGLPVGRYRTRILMRANAVRATWRRKFGHTTDSRRHLPVADNLRSAAANWPASALRS